MALAPLLVSVANVLLRDEPTKNTDLVSLEQISIALETLAGVVALVSDDVGAVTTMNPERVLILHDGDEDYLNEVYKDLSSFS